MNQENQRGTFLIRESETAQGDFLHRLLKSYLPVPCDLPITLVTC